MKRTRYTVKYRTKSDVKKENGYIQERLRWTLEDAEQLKNELLALDYIEYLGTDVEEQETNEIHIENKMNFQVSHILDLYQGEELRQKMYDLVFEWYMLGFSTGLNNQGVKNGQSS